MHHLRFGLIAEYIAILIYKIRLFKILGHRVRSSVGEIDIIAKRNQQIRFIEVKARREIDNDMLITSNQSQRIKRAAMLYLVKHPEFQNFQVQFDLIIIIPYKFPIIIHNAW